MTQLVLDDGQRDVIEIESGARQVVIAGPGTGKTEVVSSLVERLVREGGIDSAYGVLVVSFSNAAVHAVDLRLKARHGDPVTVQTMDSLAGEIVRDLADDDHGPMSFDRRVERAELSLSSEKWSRLENVEHLVVDEVQDIVGVRADLLLAILDALPEEAGFTLLGDPAQGIYDFQIRPSGGKKALSTTTSQELLATVSRMDDVATKELDGQYRAATRDARAAVALRAAVLDGGDPGSVDDFAANLVPLGTVADVVDVAQRWSGTTALLTANNGQAMLVAAALAEVGGKVDLRRGAQQRVLSRWIALLLADSPAGTVTRAQVESLLDARSPDLDAGTVWRALRAMVGSRGSEIDIKRLSRRLRAPGALLPDLLDQPGSPFVVSTVHRAKGLEFDNVVLVDFDGKPWLDTQTDPQERLRERYVALTRARHLISRVQGPDDKSLRRFSQRGLHSPRWYVGGYEKWQTFGYEMRVDDLDRSEPGGEDQSAAQVHLAKNVQVGDPLQLKLDPDRSTLAMPVYMVLHQGVPVARTSSDFGEDLAARIGSIEKKRRSWPVLRGARVEAIATAAGEPQPGAVGLHGLWLAPVISGMMQIDWNGSDDD